MKKSLAIILVICLTAIALSACGSKPTQEQSTPATNERVEEQSAPAEDEQAEEQSVPEKDEEAEEQSVPETDEEAEDQDVETPSEDAESPSTPVSAENAQNFASLLTDLVNAYEKPTKQDAQKIENDLATIEATNQRDLTMAKAIADQWKAVYLNSKYHLYLYQGTDTAEALEDAGIPDSSTHATVILGFELKNGEMQHELKGRCDAAAAIARSFPSTIIVCSGGATGENNPEGHTEAGLMKEYLVKQCGIDKSRIFIDERATTTAENAVNTMEILHEQGVQSMTIVTSVYHQRRAQMLYTVMTELYRQQYGDPIEMVGNYNFVIESSSPMQAFDDQIAVSQIAELLELPEEVRETLPSPRGATPQQDGKKG